MLNRQVPTKVPFNVQDYKEKRAAQLDRARRIREERSGRKGSTQDDFDEQPIHQPPPVSHIPQQERRIPLKSNVKELAFDDIPISSRSDGSGSAGSYGHTDSSIGSNAGPKAKSAQPPDDEWATRAVLPLPRSESAREPPTQGNKILVSETDLTKAVVNGLLSLEQAGNLWHFLTKQHQGSSSLPNTPINGLEVDHRVLPASRRPTDRWNEHPKEVNTNVHHDEYASPPSKPVVKSKPKPTGRRDWNFDTTVEPEAPTPPPLETHKVVAQQRGGKSNKPDWNSDFSQPAIIEEATPPRHAPAKRRASGAGRGPSGADNVRAAPPQPMEPPSAAPQRANDKLAVLKSRMNGTNTVKPSVQPTIQYTAQPPKAPPPSYFHANAPSRGYESPEDEEDEVNQSIIEYEEQIQQQKERNLQLDMDELESDNANMVPCPQCGRNFREDRLDKHVKICYKVFCSKPKVFNSKKQRLDPEAAKLLKQNERTEKTKKPSAPKKEEPLKALPKWKQQHEDFQNALRCARGLGPITSNFGAGPNSGPPPPPVDTRTECPHCGRRFAEDVAERHIPKCKNTVHKPNAPPRKR
eukprot:NODE_1323_length_2011_cov_40.238877_g1110_i1.p1 GENE.NODE_1323_length_2011_cov_40.238877_g1110_i1~~NODE_1323_length_2011_cov_40.238877_g1110_i1.p1  ORF type:complete len:580 (+),score=175.94 NODE_1323_length_2011_cov_40.238877_g1110_i1:70-1809(+)